MLNVADEKLKVFSHSLEKRDDGLCAFLTEDKRCSIHSDHGADAKPAMCRLFPYTFTHTPSGTFASVSFAATGVLLNVGKPLAVQTELLESRFQLFKQLFPGLSLDWNEAQLIDGQPLKWSDYIETEKVILDKLVNLEPGTRVEKTLFEEGERFRKRAAGAKLDNIAALTTNPKVIDLVLLRNLLLLYFPDDVYKSGTCELDAQAVAREFLAEPKKVFFRHRGAEYSLQDLIGIRIGRLPDQSADLLRRFSYLRIFSKLYFGAGFNYFSVIAGTHHLAILICLLRIRLKLELMHRGIANRADDADVLSILMEDTRTLERRLTVSSFGQESIAMLEILLLSPQRVERIVSIAG